VHEEAVDLVADCVAGDLRADLLDDAGVVAAEDDWNSCSNMPCTMPAAMALSAGLAAEA
jgi:hypothetical protein